MTVRDDLSRVLDALEQTHVAEAMEERKRHPTTHPRIMKVRLPKDGILPSSLAWLDRLYAGGRMPPEKKPTVFDHERSWGPWMVSVDDEPMAVLDGMSQTATLTGGFAPDSVVRAYFDGEFGDSILEAHDTSVYRHPAEQSFADTLRGLVPGLPHVAFLNSGAEANEKAFALCKLNAKNPHATKVLAFEGSFHGRTLQSLHCTWNPKKRAPYELPGFEATFVPCPIVDDEAPISNDQISALFTACAHGDGGALEALANRQDGLASEALCMLRVHDALKAGDHYAVIIEPMQSEGGDRYLPSRFYRTLRLITRAHDVALIMDEVQTGFGLGGPFSWGLAHGLVDLKCQPEMPEAITFSKRAQVGVVMSIYEDPEPTSSHVASMVRGRLHAHSIGDGQHARDIEAWVRPRLERIAAQYPDLVLGTRQQGYAFAFDLPTPDHMRAYIQQRFWRGTVVFAAGTRTIRYRLSDTYGPRELELLFESVHASLAWLSKAKNLEVPAWQNTGENEPEMDTAWRVRTLSRDEAPQVLERLLAIESAAYEPARRDTPETLNIGLQHPDGVTIVAEVDGENGPMIIGSALAGPLELFSAVEGPDQDLHLDRHSTAYSIALTVHPDHQGTGVGRALKAAQIHACQALKNTSGQPRYQWMTGRTRVGLAAHMAHLTRTFGSYEVARLTEQYGDADGEAVYYRIPLGPYAPKGLASTTEARAQDWSQGISRPLSTPPSNLRTLAEDGGLFGPTVNKITICNYISPAIVRAVEWVSALNPDHPHLYLTSCRDELVDKSIRTLKHYRKAGDVVIGLDGGYFGHTSAGARALSDPSVHRMGRASVEWPRVTHPRTHGLEQTLEQLKAAVNEAGGPEKVLGLFVEPIQERTGFCLDNADWDALDAFRAETGIPLVSFETAAAAYRGQDTAFATDKVPCIPDIRAWWPGGQTGYIHLTDTYFVPTPLTLVSTWDGDELSMVRAHYQLMAIRQIDHARAVRHMDRVCARLESAGRVVHGRGLYRVIEVGQAAADIARLLGERGLRVRAFPNGRIAFIPPMDLSSEDADAGLSVLMSGLAPTQRAHGSD